MPAIRPLYPMSFPETNLPEVVREDVREAVTDALALKGTQPDYESDPFDVMGWSDPVNLPPVELEF
jgi:hypothetical protein